MITEHPAGGRAETRAPHVRCGSEAAGLLAWTWLLDGRWARTRPQPCCLADQGEAWVPG